MRDRSAQKDIYIYIYIYISSTLKCSNDSSRLWWNWQFCKDLKIGVTPFPSIGLGRRTTTEANMLKVKEHSELLSVQYLARCLEPENVNFSITTREPPKRMMKETLFTRHHSAVEALMIAKDRKTTLQAIHTMAVNQVVTSL